MAESVTETASIEREDSFECPFCHKRGCPANGGSRKTKSARIRYRRCRHCGQRFRTRQGRDGGEYWEGLKHPETRNAR